MAFEIQVLILIPGDNICFLDWIDSLNQLLLSLQFLVHSFLELIWHTFVQQSLIQNYSRYFACFNLRS